LEENDEREQKEVRIGEYADTAASDRGRGRGVWGAEPGVSDELGGSGGGDVAYGGIDPPGAHFQSEPEAGVGSADGRKTV